MPVSMKAERVDRDLLERGWAALVDTARSGNTICYGELARAVGLPGKQRMIHRIVVSPLCSLVCHPNGYPDIASLVVRKDTGEPGDGWWGATGGHRVAQMWLDELALVHAFDWPASLPI